MRVSVDTQESAVRPCCWHARWLPKLPCSNRINHRLGQIAIVFRGEQGMIPCYSEEPRSTRLDSGAGVDGLISTDLHAWA